MNLLKEMIKSDQEKEQSISDMFSSAPPKTTHLADPIITDTKPAAKPTVQEVKVHEKEKTSSGKVGRPAYCYSNGRKMVQVTTKLCEDNLKWLTEYASKDGLRSGLISYALNRIIEEKRGIADILKKQQKS